MKIQNLTPHALTLVGENGSFDLPPSGTIARLTVCRAPMAPLEIDGGEIVGGDVIPTSVTLAVSRPTLGEITGLPPSREGVIYVASALVAEAAHRRDVFSPGELIRDEEGRVVGARGLCSYWEGGK